MRQWCGVLRPKPSWYLHCRDQTVLNPPPVSDEQQADPKRLASVYDGMAKKFIDGGLDLEAIAAMRQYFDLSHAGACGWLKVGWRPASASIERRVLPVPKTCKHAGRIRSDTSGAGLSRVPIAPPSRRCATGRALHAKELSAAGGSSPRSSSRSERRAATRYVGGWEEADISHPPRTGWSVVVRTHCDCVCFC